MIEIAHKALVLDYMLVTLVENGEALTQMPEKGVTVYDWLAEDRATFRAAAQTAWQDWDSRTPEAKAMVGSHEEFLKRIGLTQ